MITWRGEEEGEPTIVINTIVNYCIKYFFELEREREREREREIERKRKKTL